MSWFKSPLRIVLILSLAVNLFFIAMIGARIAGGPHDFRDRRGLPFGHVMRHLPEDVRQIAREVRDDYEPRFKAMRTQTPDKRAAVVASLQAEPFDRDRFEQALLGISEEFQSRGALIREKTLSFIDRLSPAQRESLAAVLKEDLRRKPRFGPPRD
ncbi:MAG: periplasmic heavy metal sensor [Neomegalonema sp.]|nr:periplasmic heavy metal sensor [Neomegalonema sp.]